MNKGKVRIYDLSKELELENKEVLEICSDLSISVKSHSSTITESQAENIREAAKTYVPSFQSKEQHHPAKKERKKPSSETTDGLKERGKEQILVVKHHLKTPPPIQPLSPQGEDGQAQSAPETVTESNAVAATEKPKLIGPPKINLPGTEEKQDKTISREENAPTEGGSAEREKPKVKLNIAKEKNQRKGKNRRKQGEETVAKFQKSKNERPKFSEIADKPTIQKPLAKSFDQEQPEEKLISKPKLKLHKPPERVIKAKEESELEKQEEGTPLDQPEQEGEQEDLLLEKPKRIKQKLKKPLKEGKSWEEDDEEVEIEKKTVKAPTKGKRRPVVIDDDEDLEDLLDEYETDATIVSLALARPESPVRKEQKPLDKGIQKAKPKPKLEKSETKIDRHQKLEKQEIPEEIVLWESLTIRQLADLLNVPDTEIIRRLFFKGIAVNITETLDLDTAKMIVEEMGVKIVGREQKALAEKTEMLAEADLDHLQRRPPVVTIMGHVDHGKTTLLDSIRQTKVAQGEAGGITQHIGAYHVDLEHEGETQQIVFLDTPGHEAFTAMRARGAKVTDIAVLVVAADDGVRPQTKEAISHAKAAKVPIVVAINKMDKPEANPDRVKQELMELELVPEDWGGDTVMVPVSALKGENLDTLLEMIVLVSEMEELSANPERPAKGTVIEANLDRTRGPVATLLIQNGTLRVGDIIVAGSVIGKIRAMIDDRGNKVEAATPSFAVEILGLNEVPAAGDEFDVYPSEKEARAIAESRAEEQRTSRLQQAMSSRRVSLSTLSAQAEQGELKELNLILKADVQGSVEAILGSLKQLPQKEVQIRVLLAAAGEITETDVDLAAASGAVVIGFNTTLAPGARQSAEQEGVDIREYNIIYKLLDEIQGAMEGLLDPEEVEETLGSAEVRAVFTVGKGAVAGCYVQSGKVVRNRFIRVLRKGEVVYNGNLDSLRRVKDDVKEVASGFECGIGVNKFSDWQEGDIIEAYEMVFKRRTLSQ